MRPSVTTWHSILICGCMHIYFFLRFSERYAHTSHTCQTHTQTLVIRPLIFCSLPGSPGMISNRAAMTGSCSSYRGSPFNINWFFFFSFLWCFTHKDSPAKDNISERSSGSDVSLSQSGRLHNYTGQRHAIQFFARFSSAEVILPSFSLPPSLSGFPSPALPLSSSSMLSDWKRLLQSNSSLITSPSSKCVQLKAATDSCLGLVVITTRWPFFIKDPTLKTYTRDIFPLPEPGLKMT